MKRQVVFDRDGARRIVRATREAERAPRGEVTPSGGPRGLSPTKYAKVTTAITAANGTTLGQGMISLQVASVSSSGVATYADLGGSPFPCYSGASSPIAVNRLIIVAVIDGFFHVIVDYC